MKLYAEEMAEFVKIHCRNNEESITCQECPFEVDRFNATEGRLCEQSEDPLCETECKCVDCPFRPNPPKETV